MPIDICGTIFSLRCTIYAPRILIQELISLTEVFVKPTEEKRLQIVSTVYVVFKWEILSRLIYIIREVYSLLIAKCKLIRGKLSSCKQCIKSNREYFAP